MLGVGRVELFGYEDGELEDTRELRRDITGPAVAADLIITLNPADVQQLPRLA